MAADPPAAADPPVAEGKGEGGRAALLGGLTTLIVALTAVATVNGEVARMFRNHAFFTGVALALVLVAILCGMLTQAVKGWERSSLLLVAGSVALVLGMGCALLAEVNTLALSDRPTISATVQLDGQNVVFHAQVEARKAKAHDQVVVIVYGVLPNDVRTGAIYYAKTGPDTNGDLSQDVQLIVDGARYSGVYLSAVVVPENVRPPNVDCDGDIVGPDGQNQPSSQSGENAPKFESFRPNGHAPLVGCLSMDFPKVGG